jgi:hypothetical protein
MNCHLMNLGVGAFAKRVSCFLFFTPLGAREPFDFILCFSDGFFYSVRPGPPYGGIRRHILETICPYSPIPGYRTGTGATADLACGNGMCNRLR